MRMTMWRNYVPSEVGSSKTLLQVRIALGVEKTLYVPTMHRLKNYVYGLVQVHKTKVCPELETKFVEGRKYSWKHKIPIN